MMNVKMGAKEVSLRKVQKDAEDSYKGGYFCCEAVMNAIRNNFEIDVPKEVIGMASAVYVLFQRTPYLVQRAQWEERCLLQDSYERIRYGERRTQGAVHLFHRIMCLEGCRYRLP